MTELKTKNIQYIDTLRALAIIGVIIVHVATPAINMNFHKNMGFWSIGLVYDSAVRFAVPLFLILSGVTMLGKEYNLAEFYKKRFTRVLIPFLFWLPANWVFRWFMLRPFEQPKEFSDIINWAGQLYLKDGVSVHLWYVYMILFLYIFLPFISKIVVHTNKKIILAFLIIWLIINTLQSYKIISTDNFPFILKKMYAYSLYAGYLVLGYYLKTISIKSNHTKLISFVVFVTTILIASIPTYFLNVNSPKQNLILLGTFTINTVIQTVSVYFIFKDSNFINKYFSLIIKTISNYSFGVYLVHVMIISVFFRYGIFWTMAHPLVSIPFVTLLTLISSLIIIYIMRKIPGLKVFAG
jgi:surface polysaccharide O-acyltransferase-like enzyme